MAAVALLLKRGGCALLLMLAGGFVVSCFSRYHGQTVFFLAILAFCLTLTAARSEELRSRRRDLAFTLVALLWAMLALPLVLPAMGVPLYVSDSVTACNSNLKNIATALEMYSTDHEGDFPNELEQLTPNYLKWVPICRRTWSKVPDFARPLFESQGIRFDPYGYRRRGAYGYEIWCRAGHQGLGENSPVYTSEEGLIRDYSCP